MLNCATVQGRNGRRCRRLHLPRAEALRPRSSAAKEPRDYSNPFLTRRHGDARLPDAPTQFHTERPRLQEGAFEAMSVTALLQSCEQPFFPWATKRLRSRGQCEVWPGGVVLEKQGGCMGQQELKLAGRSSEMPRKRK